MYVLSRSLFDKLSSSLGRDIAEEFASSIEGAVAEIQQHTLNRSVEEQIRLNVKLKEDLRSELVTKEVFEERLNTLDEKFKRMEFFQKLILAICLFLVTMANPAFMSIMEKIMK